MAALQAQVSALRAYCLSPVQSGCGHANPSTSSVQPALASPTAGTRLLQPVSPRGGCRSFASQWKPRAPPHGGELQPVERQHRWTVPCARPLQRQTADSGSRQALRRCSTGTVTSFSRPPSGQRSPSTSGDPLMDRLKAFRGERLPGTSLPVTDTVMYVPPAPTRAFFSIPGRARGSQRLCRSSSALKDSGISIQDFLPPPHSPMNSGGSNDPARFAEARTGGQPAQFHRASLVLGQLEGVLSWQPDKCGMQAFFTTTLLHKGTSTQQPHALAGLGQRYAYIFRPGTSGISRTPCNPRGQTGRSASAVLPHRPMPLDGRSLDVQWFHS